MRWVRARAAFRLVRRRGGGIAAEITTAERLGAQQIGVGGDVQTPQQYLARAHFSIGLIGAHGYEGWRYILVRAAAPVDGTLETMVDRYLELSAGSEERELIAGLVGQERVELLWVNEGVTVVRELGEKLHRGCLEALENTRELSREDWVREIAPQGEFSEWPYEPDQEITRARTVAEPPALPIRFFAPRSGAIPRSGQATLAGIRLPRGTRRPSFASAYWASDEPVDDAADLAATLADAFSRTGVWPLLWRFDDDPAEYMTEPGEPEAIGSIDVEALLRAGSEAFAARDPRGALPVGSRLPSLAAARSRSSPADNPFTRLPRGDRRAHLLLVPCNRPADAIAVIGGLACETGGPEISAVMRSWEERFGAVPVAVEPSRSWMAVDDPPENPEQAVLLAGEYCAFCPPPDGQPRSSIPELAALIGTRADPSPLRALDFQIRPHLWPVGWYD